jgi:hypothetical protein
LLSLPAGTEMFHFPALPPAALCIQAEATAHDGRQVSPFGHPRITVWLPTPRGLSQAPTSFIGSWYQGIHRVPLKTWHNKITHCFCQSQKQEMLASTVQFSRNGQKPDPGRTTALPGKPARKKTQPCGCSLRTQQCAHQARPRAPPFHPPQGDVLAGRQETRPGE